MALIPENRLLVIARDAAPTEGLRRMFTAGTAKPRHIMSLSQEARDQFVGKFLEGYGREEKRAGIPAEAQASGKLGELYAMIPKGEDITIQKFFFEAIMPRLYDTDLTFKAQAEFGEKMNGESLGDLARKDFNPIARWPKLVLLARETAEKAGRNHQIGSEVEIRTIVLALANQPENLEKALVIAGKIADKFNAVDAPNNIGVDYKFAMEYYSKIIVEMSGLPYALREALNKSAEIYEAMTAGGEFYAGMKLSEKALIDNRVALEEIRIKRTYSCYTRAENGGYYHG